MLILAFPCNQFFHQEPGSSEDIKAFITKTGGNFYVFEKSDVNGANANEVFKYLRMNSRLNGRRICWNFGKFLIDREGNIVEYYGAGIWPIEMEEDIKLLL